jgi:FtsP/CotA-like multicopper oxidase with cupredoxin domain
MAPGERCDVVIDFSAYAPGAELLLKNTAKAPYPTGEAPNPQTVGQIMLFRVVPLTGPDPSVIPPVLATVNRLSNPSRTRVMTLNEQADHEGNPVAAMLNGMPFDAPATEFPVLGTTEMWEVVNMTGDTHPIHIHLVQFQILNRQKLNAKRYEMAFEDVNPELPAMTYTPVSPTPYLKGKPVPADANERGWKDTFRMNPGEVTRVLIRFAPQDESPAFAFDATAEPGYVWHCHILEHEENDMMRPYHLVAPAPMVAQTTGVMPAIAEPMTAFRAPAPNPAVRGGEMSFTLRQAGNVELDLYTVTGQHVRSIARGWYAAGEHRMTWRREGDPPLMSGVYLVRFRGDGLVRSHKLVMLP